MALEYVRAGETVKASTVNSLVDAALGTQTPSPDLVYTTTPHGTQMSLPSKYGKPNGPLVHYLDTEMCVLSGWQFVKLALGHELDDCLEVFKLHTADGEVANPVSAAVVYQNSPESPTTDVLSGYLLSDECFGLDRAAGSSGWVQTLIEYTNGQVPAKAELWSWRKPEEMAAVFTNVEDQLSVKNMLSVLLDNGGVDSDKLSSLERIGSWPLTYATSLSVMRDGHVKWVPTHQLVRVHDDIEIWDSEEVKTHHVNTASLVCYDLETHEDQQTGKTVIDNAKFAWKYWLGPDSSFEDGESIKFAYSHSWTINGQPAVFKVEEEIEDIREYEGEDVAIEDERGGYSVLHGIFELNPEDGEEDEQGNIDAGSLFVNFNYYEEYAAMIGELGAQNNSTVSELSKSCFLAKQKEKCRFAEGDEISIGMELPRRYFIFGTWSAVDKDRPLADEECPEYEDGEKKEKKSLQWKDNKPDDDHSEPVDETGVKSLQLYRFSETVKSECDCLSDLQLSDQVVFVARREDGDGNAWIDYINLDSLSSNVDSNIDTLYLSSIQEKAFETEDGAVPYHQLYGFDGPNIELDSNNLDKFDLVVRDSNTPAQGAQVSYIPISSVLSGTDTFTDTQMSQMSSIEYDNDGNGPYLQIYKFNDDKRVDLGFDDFGRYDLVARDNQDGHVDYATLSGVASALVETTIDKAVDLLSTEVDSELPALMLSSIQTSSWTDPETDEEHRYHQLFNFQLSSQDVDWDLKENYDIVLRDNYTVSDGSIVNYMPLSSVLWRPDSEGDNGQKSTSFLSGTRDLQLYKFDENGQGQESAEVPVWWKAPANVLSDEILVRVGGAGGELQYKQLALKQAMLSVDRNTYGSQKSLQYADIDGKTFLELNGFHANGSTLPKVTITSADTSLLPADNEFVIRKKVGGFWQIDYAPLSACMSASVSANVSVDTDVVGTQRSIEWAEDDGQEYLQLYGMDMPDADPETVTVTETGVAYHLLPDDYAFVVRTEQGGIIEYKDVSLCCMLSGHGDPRVSCDTEKIQDRKSLDLVLSGNGAPYYQLHNFQKAAGTGPWTYVKFYDQPLSGQDFSIGCQTQFVVRQPDGMGGYEIRYQTLSIEQEHERVDTWTSYSEGQSIDYTSYDEGFGCYQVLELYNFRWGCSQFITSADISSEYGNGILIRKWNADGCCWYLDYMNFDSLDELAIKYIGDSQLSLSAHNPYQRSAEVYYDQADQKKYVQLYGFDTDIDNASVTIHNDGCTYYWPQDVKTDQHMTEWDYILVKHIDSNGHITLQYKQLEVTMPDIASIEGDIQNIYGDINNFYDEINYLSGCIDDLSGSLSGNYWESGGDITTCYGSGIGDSNGCIAIDLDNRTCYGNYWWFTGYSGGGWFGGNNLDVEGIADLQSLQLDHLGNGDGLTFANGCTHIHNSNSYFEGTVGVGCMLNIGCSYFNEGSLRVGCSLTIGSTTIDEAQLSALLQLVNAPQMLQNL